MKVIKRLLTIALMALAGVSLASCATGGLKSSNSLGYGPVSMRAPYASYSQYFGYVSPDVKPDGKYKGKDVYYLYFWVPAVIDEVGISMYSPADKEPSDSDFKSPAYDAGMAKDKDAFFDTYIVLDRMDILDPTKIKDGGKVFSTLQTNDDDSEMPANPSGSHYNSLLRHVSEVSDPMKALVRGVYRIGFTSFRGNVQGSYIATIGTTIPGVKVAATLDELHKIVNEE